MLKITIRHLVLTVLFAALSALSIAGCASHASPSADELSANQQPLTAVIQINSGGKSVGSFVADQFFNTGLTNTTDQAVSTAGVTNAAPASVYQSERFGDFNYTLTRLTANAPYTVRLHFAEIHFTEAGQRVFNVSINGTKVLSSLDIVALVGANKALVRDFAVKADTTGKIVVTYQSITNNAKASGIEILSPDTATQAPTVATPASANPNPVTSGKSTLTVLGADDAGEASLVYTWATTGTPPAAVSFSVNGSNAAKSTVATFSSSGTYNLLVTIRDQSGLSTTSTVTVTVSGSANAAPSVATPAAANPNPVTGTTSTLSVLGADDAGEASLIYTWATTGTPPGAVTFSPNGTNAAKSTVATFSAPGSYSLQVTIRDAMALTTTSSVVVTVSSQTAATAVYRINAGGGAVSPFAMDQYSSGGTMSSITATVSTSGVANAAPSAVYQSERYGDYAYTLGSLTPNAGYLVRLHFAELHWTEVGGRRFNVSINGTTVLSNFDIFAVAGAKKAVVRDFSATASSSGQIVIQLSTLTNNATCSGVEIFTAGGGGGGAGSGGSSSGGASSGGAGGASSSGGSGGASGGSGGAPSGNGALLFDDFTSTSLDSTKWTGGFDRQPDTVNNEANAVVPANVKVSGGNLSITAKREDATARDRDVNPPHNFVGSSRLYNYTSGQIQQATAPFLYGTVEARIKTAATSGVWPCFWMLGYEWQASQPYTANVSGHNWPHDGWFEIDIAEFHGGGTSGTVSNGVHWQTGDGFHDANLVFSSSSRFMVYRLQWQPNSMIWSYDAEDGAGFRTTRTVTGSSNIPNKPAFIIFNLPVGGAGSGTIVDGDFPKSMLVDWVRVTQ